MNRQILKNTCILVCITLIAGIALGTVYTITKDPIAKQEQSTKEAGYRTVYKEAEKFLTGKKLNISDSKSVLGEKYAACTVEEAVPAADADNHIIGYVVTVTCSEGYGGDLTVMVGVSGQGTVKGIEFLTLNETAGLGMNAKNASFKNQFRDKKAGKLSVTKEKQSSDNEIAAISSATVTSKAVTKAVNAAAQYITSIGKKGVTTDE